MAALTSQFHQCVSAVIVVLESRPVQSQLLDVAFGVDEVAETVEFVPAGFHLHVVQVEVEHRRLRPDVDRVLGVRDVSPFDDDLVALSAAAVTLEMDAARRTAPRARVGEADVVDIRAELEAVIEVAEQTLRERRLKDLLDVEADARTRRFGIDAQPLDDRLHFCLRIVEGGLVVWHRAIRVVVTDHLECTTATSGVDDPAVVALDFRHLLDGH